MWPPKREVMKCHVCGGEMNVSHADLPFKTDGKTFVILKELPVTRCENCTEQLLDDQTMAKAESMLVLVRDHMTPEEIDEQRAH